jgi:hypothetical protein
MADWSIQRFKQHHLSMGGDQNCKGGFLEFHTIYKSEQLRSEWQLQLAIADKIICKHRSAGLGLSETLSMSFWQKRLKLWEVDVDISSCPLSFLVNTSPNRATYSFATLTRPVNFH